jgi:hypothetical protein
MTLIAALLALVSQDGIPPEKFDALRLMIKPQAGEQRFWRIPWKLTISEAREDAARDGKPIFVWAGAGGAPIGVC